MFIQDIQFPQWNVWGFHIAIHRLEVTGLLAYVIEGSEGTSVIDVVVMAYSPVGCNGVNITILDPIPQVLQFKACLI